MIRITWMIIRNENSLISPQTYLESVVVEFYAKKSRVAFDI